MKKYMIPVVAMLFVASVAGAQTTQKQPSQSTPAKKETAAKKSATASTGSVASTTKAATDAKATTVDRKHHHKKAKPVTKTESK